MRVDVPFRDNLLTMFLFNRRRLHAVPHYTGS